MKILTDLLKGLFWIDSQKLFSVGSKYLVLVKAATFLMSSLNFGRSTGYPDLLSSDFLTNSLHILSRWIDTISQPFNLLGYGTNTTSISTSTCHYLTRFTTRLSSISLSSSRQPVYSRDKLISVTCKGGFQTATTPRHKWQLRIILVSWRRCHWWTFSREDNHKTILLQRRTDILVFAQHQMVWLSVVQSVLLVNWVFHS